jgi:hypothetical protein
VVVAFGFPISILLKFGLETEWLRTTQCLFRSMIESGDLILI